MQSLLFPEDNLDENIEEIMIIYKEFKNHHNNNSHDNKT